MKILVASLLAATLALGLGARADASAHAKKAAPHAHDHGQAKHATEPAAFVKCMLVDHHGMTLYTFDPDVAESGKSASTTDALQPVPRWSPRRTTRRPATSPSSPEMMAPTRGPGRASRFTSGCRTRRPVT